MKVTYRLLESLMFIAIAVSLTAVAEWQNNVLMNYAIRGWSGYIETLAFNAVFMGIPAYLVFVWLRTKYPVAKVIFIHYCIWGLVGLLFEWFFIGHFPWSYAVQTGLVTYWAGVFAAPLLFLLPSERVLRLRAAVYLVVGSVLMAALSVFVMSVTTNNDLLLLGIILSWMLFYPGILHFLLRTIGLGLTRLEYLSLALITPVIEVVTLSLGLVPVKFLVFVITVALVGWRVRRRYQQLVLVAPAPNEA